MATDARRCTSALRRLAEMGLATVRTMEGGDD
jgi:hypothetical protein